MREYLHFVADIIPSFALAIACSVSTRCIRNRCHGNIHGST